MRTSMREAVFACLLLVVPLVFGSSRLEVKSAVGLDAMSFAEFHELGRKLLQNSGGGQVNATAYPCPDAIQGDTTLINAINSLRARYGAAPLSWNEQFAQNAQTYLNYSGTCDGTAQARSATPQPVFLNISNGLVGVGYTGSGNPLGRSFKCVQAVNDWFVSGASASSNALQSNQVTDALLPFAALMWNSTESVGCGLVVCGTQWVYKVMCYFQDPTLSITVLEPSSQNPDIAVLEENLFPATGKYPIPYLSNVGDSPEAIAASYNLTAAELYCYNGQIGGQVQIGLGQYPLTIPAPHVAPTTCSDYDYYQKTTPSAWTALADDTIDTVAANYGLIGNDLCCYNSLYNTTTYNFCKEIPLMDGFSSLFMIPTRDSIAERNCTSDVLQYTGVYSCPDEEDAVFAMNQFRSTRGLLNMSWDDALASQANEFLGRGSCANPYATRVPSGIGVTLQGSTAAPKCSAGVIMHWGSASYYAQLAAMYDYGTGNEDQLPVLQMFTTTIMKNSTDRFGCSMQACGPYYVNIFCLFNQVFVTHDVSSSNSTSTQTQAVPPLTASCPVSVFPTNKDVSLVDFAKAYNVTPQEVVCWANQMNDIGDSFRIRWATGIAVAVPCPGALGDPQHVTCPDWEAYQGHCGVSYLPFLGDTFSNVAQRFYIDSSNTTRLSGEELCCYTRSMSAVTSGNCSSLPMLDEIQIPCADALHAAGCTQDEVMAAMAASKPTSNSGSSSSSSGSSSNTGAIVGGIVGGVVAAAVVAIVAYILFRRKTHRKPMRVFDGKSFKPASFDDERYTWVDEYVENSNSIIMFGQQNYGSKVGVIAKFFKHKEAFDRERTFYASQSSPDYFPEWYDAQDEDKHDLPYIIVERGTHTLKEYLKKPGSTSNKAHVKAILLDIGEGIKLLHGRGVVHGDIKPENIMFFTSNHHWKLIDFGTWSTVGDNVVPSYSLRYSAPELVQAAMKGKEMEVSAAADMWSFGMLMWECLVGEPLFKEFKDEDVQEMLLGVKPFPFEADPNLWLAIKEEQARRFVHNLLQRQPHFRWDIKRCLDNAFFKEAEDTVMTYRKFQGVAEKQAAVLNKLDEVATKIDKIQQVTLENVKKNVSDSMMICCTFEEIDMGSDHLDDDVDDDDDMASCQSDDLASCVSDLDPKMALKAGKDFGKGKEGNKKAELLYKKYVQGGIPTTEAPLSLLSTLAQEEKQVFLLHMNGKYIVRLQLTMCGEEDVPVETIESVSLMPAGNPEDAVSIPIHVIDSESDEKRIVGFGVWDTAAHEDAAMLNATNIVEVEINMKLKNKFDEDSIYVKPVVFLRMHAPGETFTVQRLAPRLMDTWDNAPEWVKLSAWGAQWFYSLF